MIPPRRVPANSRPVQPRSSAAGTAPVRGTSGVLRPMMSVALVGAVAVTIGFRSTGPTIRLKDASARQLADGVRVLAAGEALLAPSVTRRLIAEFARPDRAAPRPPARERVEELTGRETQMLALIAQGMSNGEIAAHLVIAESTVKTHVNRILAKLGLRDRTQAAVFAYEAQLITPS